MKTAQYSIALLVLMALPLAAQTQSVPPLVNYQGRLLNPDGTALATGDYQLTFKVYDSATNSGGLIWGPQIFDGPSAQGHGSMIPVVQGYFNVMLGPADTNGVSLASAFTNVNSYVEVTVTNHLPILPRQRILTAPFAFNSATLAGADWSALFGTNDPYNGKLPGARLVNGSVTAAQIAPGTITASQIASGAITAQQIDSATWQLATNLNGGNAALASNVVSGISITNATISGNGGGLTNVTAATPAIPPGMALVPAGAFTMGDNLDGESDAMPTVTVTVSAFYMDVNLVSFSQWQSVYFWATNHGYGFDNAGSAAGAIHPVQTVNWYDCAKWSNARSQQAGLTPVYYTDAGWTQVYTNGDVDTVYANWAVNGYRLPTEAEWEKAARGGLSGQRFPWGNIITEYLANYSGATGSFSYDLGPNGYNSAGGESAPYTTPVGYFAANGYGLYDMAGNVEEWCWDWAGTPYAGGSDPRGPVTGSARMLRGGSWVAYASYTRCADRRNDTPTYALNNFGFRCVRGR